MIGQMTWLGNFSSSFGVGGSAVLAASIYSGSVALEKAINPDRKKDLIKFLTSSAGLVQTPNTGQVILTLFEGLFGKRHLSWKCLIRSIFITIITVALISIAIKIRHPAINIFHIHGENYARFLTRFGETLVVIICGAILPDYISLWKARYLLHYLALHRSLVGMIILFLFDLLISAAISFIFIDVFAVSAYYYYGVWWIPNVVWHDDIRMITGLFYATGFYAGPIAGDFAYLTILLISTMFSSIWVLTVGASAILLRSLLSLTILARFTRYMFDIQQHPVRALGLVCSTIAWLASVALTFI